MILDDMISYDMISYDMISSDMIAAADAATETCSNEWKIETFSWFLTLNNDNRKHIQKIKISEMCLLQSVWNSVSKNGRIIF